jgi:hypothetical protein
MTSIKSAIWSLIIIGLLSCSNGNDKTARYVAPVVVDEATNFEVDQAKSQTNERIERKVIKSGEIKFQTKNIQETTAFITENVKNLKGYISSDNVYNSEDRITSRLEIRIPSDSFDVLLSRISENVNKIEYKNVQLQDVTEEYIDVETRIKTKKELENRYMELLSRAKTVQEILSIEKELGTLRSDIESIEGRLKYLKDQVSFSALTVDYYQMTSTTLNFSSKLGKAFVTGWRFLLSFIIGLVNMWPFIIIIGLVVILIIRFNRKGKTIKNAS